MCSLKRWFALIGSRALLLQIRTTFLFFFFGKNYLNLHIILKRMVKLRLLTEALKHTLDAFVMGNPEYGLNR